jgi:hypothetical protein
MTIQAYLENIRAKPDHVRQKIAFWSAFGLTAVIFAFWLASFSFVGAPAKATVASAVSEAGAPGQSMVASVGGFFGDIKDLFFGTKTVTYSDIEVTPGNK